MVTGKKKAKPATRSTKSTAKSRTTSKVKEAINETARDFFDGGLMDIETMRKFDALCLPEIPDYTPAQIKSIRIRCKTSQAVFARYMNVSTSSLQKWEIGEKRPSNIALKLLNIVDRKGLEVLI